MSSYNPVNGVQMAENRRLLTDVLRDEWGFDGIVVSDWGGVKDRIEALLAGNDLDMPENQRNNKTILEAVRDGRVSEEDLDLVGRGLSASPSRQRPRRTSPIPWTSKPTGQSATG